MAAAQIGRALAMLIAKHGPKQGAKIARRLGFDKKSIISAVKKVTRRKGYSRDELNPVLGRGKKHSGLIDETGWPVPESQLSPVMNLDEAFTVGRRTRPPLHSGPHTREDVFPGRGRQTGWLEGFGTGGQRGAREDKLFTDLLSGKTRGTGGLPKEARLGRGLPPMEGAGGGGRPLGRTAAGEGWRPWMERNVKKYGLEREVYSDMDKYIELGYDAEDAFEMAYNNWMR